MQEKFKDFLYVVGGLVFPVLVITTFGLLVIGGAKLFEWIYPILIKVSIFTWSIVWLLVIFSIIPRFREFTGTGIVIGTYIGGAIFWFLSFYVTYSLWGVLGILIGVLFLGLGVYFTAILALLFSGQFTQALFFIFNLLSIFLLRSLGLWIITKYKPKERSTSEKELVSEKYIAVPARKLSKKPLSLGVVFLSIFLFIFGTIELFVFLKNPVINMKILWSLLAIAGGIGLLLQKFWAYRLTQAILVINIIMSPFYIFSYEFTLRTRLIVVMISIIVSGLILFYLSRKTIKEQFLEPVFTDKFENQ